MAEKILIDLYRKKTLEEFSESFPQNSSIETGSISALTASMSAVLLKRAAETIGSSDERVEYIRRNTEIIRNYMVYLIDEDVKCRGPMRKAVKEGDPLKIEACIQPACAINSEIINMMQSLLDFCEELFDYVPRDTKHYIVEAANLAFSAIEVSVSYILHCLKDSSDETYIYVTKRENEIACKNSKTIVDLINQKAEMPF